MKRARKILVSLMAMVMLFGFTLTANAAGELPVGAIKTITAKQENAQGKMVAVSNITVYTNDANKPIEVSYTWDAKKGTEPVGVIASSSDRGVVKVDNNGELIINGEPEDSANGNTGTVTGTLTLTPVADGKATITIADKVNAKKTKKIKVTVKTYAEEIGLSGSTVEGGTVYVAEGGKVNLGAYVTNAATDTKLKYAMESSEPKGKVKVDAKGNVTALKGAKSAVVTITSNDKKVKKDVTVAVNDIKVKELTAVQDTTATKAELGLLNKKNVLTMKGNAASAAHTYQLNLTLNEEAKVSDVSFVSSKTSVATVDANGKITAVGNGKATITVAPKLGNTAKVDGKAVTAKITVNVTTDVETVSVAKPDFTILANNKDMAKIAAATNANASNKAVKYEVLSFVDESGAVKTVADFANQNKFNAEAKKYITVDAKGNAKAKKVTTAVVRAYAVADKTIANTATVSSVTPVSSITLATAEGQTPVKNKKVTVFKTGADTQQPLTLVPTLNAEASNKDVVWSTNKPSVATVDENGVVKAVGNGTANITATAADGSGKKATVAVTVKTDAYEINVAKAQTVSGNSVVYVEGKKDKATKYGFANCLKALTNTDASIKTVAYDQKGNTGNAVTSASLKAGESVDVVITAKDTRREAGAVTKEVTIACVDSDQIAKSYTVTSADTVALKAGEKTKITATVIPEEGKISADLTTVTWSSKTAAVAAVAKDGTITAKKAGVAEVIATYKYKDAEGRNATATASTTVNVGRKEADVQKEVNNAFTATLNEEDRSYTGVTTKFDAKKNNFALTITDPDKDFTQLRETGIVAAIEGIATKNPLMSYNNVVITDKITGEVWNIARSGAQAVVTAPNGTETTLASAGEAIEYVLTAGVGENKQLKDWNGKSYDVAVTVSDKYAIGATAFDYTMDYTVNVTMSETLYRELMDNAIAEAAAQISVAGIEEVAYDAAGKTVTVTAENADQNIAEAYAAAKDATVDALLNVFEDAQSVTMTVKTPVGNENVAKERTPENSTKEFVTALLDEYMNKLSGRATTYAELDSSTAIANVTYVVGNMTYSQSYKMNFVLGEKAFDNAADAAINELLTAAGFDFGKVDYAAADNALTIKFNQNYAAKAPMDLIGTGVRTIIEKMIGNTKVTGAIVNNGTPKVINLTELSTTEGATAILGSLVDLENVKTLADMDGMKATIKVTYTSGNSEKTLIYTVAFGLADGVVLTEDAMTEEETTTEEATTEEETTTEEVTTEEETTTEEATTEEETTTEEATTEEETTTEEATTEEETTTEEVTTEEETTTEEAAEEVTTEEATTEETVL